MIDISVQFAVLAQGSDMEGWVDLLIVAAMAIFWLIGGLVKAARNKAAERRERESTVKVQRREQRPSWQDRLIQKAEEMQRAAEAKGRQIARRVEEEAGLREQGGRPAQPAGRITIRTGQRGEAIMVYEKPQAPSVMEREEQAARQQEAKEAVAAARRSSIPSPPPIETKVVRREGSELGPMGGALTGVTNEPPEPLQLERAGPVPAGESVGLEPTAVIDYSDPDALKKAILHYEILGKPVALRDSAEKMSTF